MVWNVIISHVMNRICLKNSKQLHNRKKELYQNVKKEEKYFNCYCYINRYHRYYRGYPMPYGS